MLDGTVKWFDSKKGYGFISSDADGADVFVHYTSFADSSMRMLCEGDKVSFAIAQGEKGPRADNVRLAVQVTE